MTNEVAEILFELTQTLTNFDFCLLTKMQVVCNMSRKTNQVHHDALTLMHKVPMLARDMPALYKTLNFDG